MYRDGFIDYTRTAVQASCPLNLMTTIQRKTIELFSRSLYLLYADYLIFMQTILIDLYVGVVYTMSKKSNKDSSAFLGDK